MKEISKIGADIKDSSEKGAIKGIKKSQVGSRLGMDKNGEFEKKYDFKDGADISDTSGLNVRNTRTQEMINEAKDIVKGDNKYETFMIEKGTKNYDTVKKWQESIVKVVNETYSTKDNPIKETFDDIYNKPSYSASLLKYVMSGKELKVKDGKLDEEIKKKLSASDTAFSQIDLAK